MDRYVLTSLSRSMSMTGEPSQPNEKRARITPKSVKKDISSMDIPDTTKAKACAEVEQIAATRQSGGKLKQSWDNVTYGQYSSVGMGGKLPQQISDVEQDWKAVKPEEDGKVRPVPDTQSKLGIHFE